MSLEAPVTFMQSALNRQLLCDAENYSNVYAFVRAVFSAVARIIIMSHP